MVWYDPNTRVFAPSVDKDSIGLNLNALASQTTGTKNTAIGARALDVTTTGANNTALGVDAGGSITTGSSNTVIGNGVASTTLTTGSNNILIGTSATITTSGASTSNTLDIGGAVKATGLGSTNAVTMPGTLGVTGLITASGGVAGAINGTIGAGTPAAGTFTTMTSTDIVVGGNTLSGTEIGYLDGLTIGNTAASKAVVLDATESLSWVTTDSTATETCTLSIQDTRTGAGTTGWTQKSELVSNVALGAYANATYGLVTFGATGAVVGLAAGVCGEVELSAGTTAGTYASLEAELTANSACSTGTDTAFLYANIAGSNGTGKTTINTNGHFAVLGTGVVNTANGLFDEVSSQVATATARLRIKVGAATWYIPLCANSALN